MVSSSSRLHFMTLHCFTITSFHNFADYCLISTSLFHLQLCYKHFIRYPDDALILDFVNFLLFPRPVIHRYQTIFLVFLNEMYRKEKEHIWLKSTEKEKNIVFFRFSCLLSKIYSCTEEDDFSFNFYPPGSRIIIVASSSRLHFMTLQCFTIDSFHSFAYYCLISTSLFHLHLCYNPLIRHPNDELFKDFVNFLLFPWSIIHCYQSYFFCCF